MDKAKKEQIILVILVPVFLLGLLYMRSQQNPSKTQANLGGLKQTAAPDRFIESMPGPGPVEDSVYQASKQDPFKNLLQAYLYDMRKAKPQQQVEALPLPTITIEGIVWNSPMPQAIVNRKVVRIGDYIDDFEIVDISRDGITIDYNGEQVLIERR
jgi:hypothetical protein